MTVRPPRSMTRVAGPASARMSEEFPTPAIFLSRTASACARRGVIDDDLAVDEDDVGGLGAGGDDAGAGEKQVSTSRQLSLRRDLRPLLRMS